MSEQDVRCDGSCNGLASPGPCAACVGNWREAVSPAPNSAQTPQHAEAVAALAGAMCVMKLSGPCDEHMEQAADAIAHLPAGWTLTRRDAPEGVVALREALDKAGRYISAWVQPNPSKERVLDAIEAALAPTVAASEEVGPATGPVMPGTNIEAYGAVAIECEYGY